MRKLSLNAAQTPSRASAVLVASIFLITGAVYVSAQVPMPPMGQPATTNTAGQNRQLRDQIVELRAQVARLQAAVEQTGAGNGLMATPGMPAGVKKMGMMGEMGGMAPPANSAMAVPTPAMGMCCMGEMGMPPGGNAGMSGANPRPGMAGMNNPSSAMPGQPGGSHLLHIGSTGFYLNHSEHITLTPDQRARLNRLKEKAMLEQASAQRGIDQGEQELYTLTGTDQPDNARIAAKIADIEKMRAAQRMNFIQLVTDASNILTHEQHQALLGTMPANGK